MKTRRKHDTRIHNERLWQAIDIVCKGRIRSDKSHHMNKKHLQYHRYIEDGKVILQLVQAPTKKTDK